MVLRLSDLVKKSIDKGYGTKTLTSEKPWTQGNLSLIDLKTEKNPFVKNTPTKRLQIAPLPENVPVYEAPPPLASQPAPRIERHAPPPINKTKHNPLSDPHWWENVNLDTPTQSDQPMRMLVNYNLLCDDV